MEGDSEYIFSGNGNFKLSVITVYIFVFWTPCKYRKDKQR